MAIRVIVEFLDDPIPAVVIANGLEITGQSTRFNLIYAKGTKAQIESLSDDPRVKTISLSAEIQGV